MFGKASTAFFLFAIFLSAGSYVKLSQTERPPVDEKISSDKIEAAKQTVEFKSVSFAFDPKIFGEVTSAELEERLLENATDKPDNVAPRRIAFKLRKPGQPREATITVYPIADFRRVWAPAEKNWTKQFDKDLRDLRKTINNTDFRVENEIPYLPFVDASQTFQAKVKKFVFPSGEGIFFLTQIDIERSLVNNEGLTYLFQGISSDGKHYVLAEFPVSVSFLPRNYEANEFEGYRLPDNFFADPSHEKTFQVYVSNVRERLEKLPSYAFAPPLTSFEAVISSLKIAK